MNESYENHRRRISTVDPKTITPKLFVSNSCEGELCYCGAPASHKVEETLFDDDPARHRHPLTRYICHAHFRLLMGPAAG